jgi:NAD(P)-dependent dehydrogenase (short-subunit alcohol dehydrogenase family)
LGRRFATVLHAAGADVIVTGRRSEQLEQLAGELGGRVSVVAGDLVEASHRERLVDHVRERFGRLDVLVNNAGRCDDGPLVEEPLKELRAVLELNLLAQLDLCRLMAPLLFISGQASVINVASVFGLLASRAPMVGYNASKGAGERAGARILPDRADRAAARPGAAAPDCGAHAVGPGTERGGAGWSTAVPGLRRVQLRDRPGLGRGRRLDRVLISTPAPARARPSRSSVTCSGDPTTPV